LKKNDITEPKAMLIASKGQLQQLILSKFDDFIFEQFCLQMVADTDLYWL